MSRSKRRSDNTAPALFPFLAVLLCTIGALVLILVITVTNSHASARRDAALAMEEVKDSSDLVEVVSEELEAQRESLKSKIERRRRDLADIEDHIDRLNKNLEQLGERMDRIQSETSETEASLSEKSERLAKLRTEIDAKKKELLDEIEKQKQRKPAFAVIPYVGNNGTSRRPVYLECSKDGVIVQPEGILISSKDLKPPLGPGNPLDAALRVLRLAYQQRDATFGITQPPYPLLLVRPDGIHTYALAREAMSGWDDQFGYELIDSDMDLKFPTGIPGLKEQLTQTIDLANKRQQAYVAMIPRSRLAQNREDDWDAIDATATSSGNGSQAANTQGSGSNGTGDVNHLGLSGTSQTSGANNEWKLVQGVANSQVANAIQKNGLQSESMPANGSAFNADGTAARSGSLSQSLPNAPATTNTELTGQFVAGNLPKTVANGSNQANQTNGGSINGPASGSAAANTDGTVANEGSSTATGSSSSSWNSTGQGGSGTSAMGSQSPNGSNAPQPQGANALSSGSATGSPISELQSNAGAPPAPSQPNNAASIKKNLASDSSPPKAKHVNPDGDLKPISVTAGKGWAASRAEGKATPVTRPIYVVALKDRWLLRSDVDPSSFDANITMEEGPQQAGNQLAASLRKRVDSWGLSLPGGFWSPTLTIEAASDAQQSVTRLERLLEGSGVEIQVVPLKLPNRR